MVNNPLRSYFLGGGGIGGVPLDSHDGWLGKNMDEVHYPAKRTLPETNSKFATENRPKPKRKLI